MSIYIVGHDTQKLCTIPGNRHGSSVLLFTTINSSSTLSDVTSKDELKDVTNAEVKIKQQ